jgi:hypothetical protein
MPEPAPYVQETPLITVVTSHPLTVAVPLLVPLMEWISPSQPLMTSVVLEQPLRDKLVVLPVTVELAPPALADPSAVPPVHVF